MTFSIVIATYNRAALLADTLASLSRLQPGASWEVIVVDNNSPDNTRAVVEAAAAAYPVPLRYAFEKEQGRSAALNCGFRLAAGDIVVTTDDDVRVAPDWLTTIARGLETLTCDYVGGRVTPLFESRSLPAWFPEKPGLLWGVIALLDYGGQPVKFGVRVPLGVNMAVRRKAIERAGGFDTRIGRKAGTLLGQEVREWCLRAHAAGLVGYYSPDIVVQHLIPAERLTKRYFRRWFYWRGISRAMLYADTGLDMEKPEQSSIDFRTVHHIAGVPRYLFRSAVTIATEMIAAVLRRDPVTSFEREMWLCTFAGIVRQRWADRRRPIGSAAGARRAEGGTSVPARPASAS
jgi:glycosyltransferase involved in cell wall biosynthesis